MLCQARAELAEWFAGRRREFEVALAALEKARYYRRLNNDVGMVLVISAADKRKGGTFMEKSKPPITKLERMERDAQYFGPQVRMFTGRDSLEVIYNHTWVPGTRYEYRHNGVAIDRDRARELVPGYDD